MASRVARSVGRAVRDDRTSFALSSYVRIVTPADDTRLLAVGRAAPGERSCSWRLALESQPICAVRCRQE